MIEKHCKTAWARIYISGPIHVIEQACRTYCLDVGLCVTVEPTKFVYTGSEELGAVVGLINYPRSESSQQRVTERAMTLAGLILDATMQHSVLVMTPDDTTWITKRSQS